MNPAIPGCLQILDSAECFSLENFTFLHTSLLLRQRSHVDGEYITATTRQRKSTLRVTIPGDMLDDPILVPREAYQPIPPPDCTVAYMLEQSDRDTVSSSL